MDDTVALLITEHDVRSILAADDAMASAIEAIYEVSVEQAADRLAMLPRVQLRHPDDESATHGAGAIGRTIRLMPSIAPRLDVGCVRLYTTSETGGSVGTAAELLVLVDAASMQLEALIEDHSLHTLRTAAPTGLATELLSRRDSQTVCVIGTGRHARGQLAAVASVRALSSVVVVGRDRRRAERYCQEMEELIGTPVRPCTSAEEGVRTADIVCLAAATSEPVIDGSWLEPGAHVNSISPSELDGETVRRSTIFPSYTRQILEGTPIWSPFPELVAAGELRPGDLSIQLCDVAAGSAEGRGDRNEITLFLSSGMAGWDAAIGRWALQRARTNGLGRELWDTASGRSVDGYVSPRPSPVGSVSLSLPR